MIDLKQLGLVCSFLLLAVLPASVFSQQADSAPPPPPGQVGAPALEGPVTDLEPIPQTSAARDRSPAQGDAVKEETTHDALKAADANERSSRVYAPSRRRRNSPSVQQAGGQAPGTSGSLATGSGTRAAASLSGCKACGTFRRRE